MEASFVIGYHTARSNNLLQTLRFLVDWHFAVVRESQLILVCQNGLEEIKAEEAAQLWPLLAAFQEAEHHDMHLECMKLPVVTNHGVDCAKAEKVIVLESDRILPRGYFAKAIATVQPGLMMTSLMIHKLTKPASDEEISKDAFEYKEDMRSEFNMIGRRNMWSGNTTFMKSDYYQAGQMDENYVGYGWADTDMTRRMEKAGVKSVWAPDIELHLWHPPATYGTGDQKKMFIDNGLHFCQKWGCDVPIWLQKEIAVHRGLII